MFNFIADYRDPAGREYHQAFQVSADDKRAASWRILWELRMQGYIISALLIISGSYTLDQLTRMADDGPANDQYEIACLEPAFLEALKKDGPKPACRDFRGPKKEIEQMANREKRASKAR